MGLSFLVAEGVDRLDVTVRWGDYRYVEDATRDDGRTDDEPDGSEASGSTDGPADGAVVKSEGVPPTRWRRIGTKVDDWGVYVVAVAGCPRRLSDALNVSP